MTEENSHDELIREQFTLQAAGWDTYVQEGDNEEVLSWIIRNLELRPELRALDVAAGTGLVARALAPGVGEVAAVEVTPEMIVQGRKLAAAEGLTNVTFDEADARSLPYAAASFDLVASRLAMHHFEEPGQILREMVRVCESGGHIAIIDITTPEDAAAAASHNRLEQLRDPSHTRALPPSRLQEMVEESGLELTSVNYFDAKRDLESWLDFTETPAEARSVIISELEGQLEGGPDTGMLPSLEDGRLMFIHRWMMLVGRKP